MNNPGRNSIGWRLRMWWVDRLLERADRIGGRAERKILKAKELVEYQGEVRRMASAHMDKLGVPPAERSL